MPANPEQLHAALTRISRDLVTTSQLVNDSREEALHLLHQLALEPEALRARVETVVASFDGNLRCALPADENMAVGYSCTSPHESSTIVAVDGSQVVPDRHEEVLFGLINVGSVVSESDSGKAPDTSVDTTILFGGDLYPENGPLLTEGDISLRRDRQERSSLLSLAPRGSEAFIALTDGPLELWGAKDVTDPRSFESALSEYLRVLRELERRNWIIAGYVDKPGADLVMRLFEVAKAAPEELKTLRNYHPLQSISDRWLFAQVLATGDRSAIFAIQSTSRARYPGSLSIHFFYLNVGSEQHPLIARVEIPQWVAMDPIRVNRLHRALLDQCASLGSRPYPYILHRAHETAKISWEEKEQIKLRILLELRRQGVETEQQSAKSSAKARAEIKGSF